LQPHSFIWTANLDLAEASFDTVSTEMAKTTVENPKGYQSSYVEIHCSKNTYRKRGTWLAQLVEHPTLDLGVVSPSPTLGVDIN